MTKEYDTTIRNVTLQFVVEMIVMNVIGGIIAVLTGASGTIQLLIIWIGVSVAILARLFNHVDGIVVHRLEQHQH